MAKLVLFEDFGFANLLPLVYWRTVFGLRSGRKSLIDRTALRLGMPVVGLWTRDWISAVASERYMLPINEPVEADTLLVNGRWLMTEAPEIKKPPFAGVVDGHIAYIACDQNLAGKLRPADLLDMDRAADLLKEIDHEPVAAELVRYPWDLIAANGEALKADWEPDERVEEGSVHPSAHLIEPEQIHIGPGARIEAMSIVDATLGPIYLSENSVIRPYAHLEGPAYIGPGATINPHGHVWGGTSLGPVCRVGGEVGTCIFSGYSNKQHYGFLGHSYVGSWVNLGAGTVNSNLKNTYGSVRVPLNGREVDTGATFFGAVIADHVKTSIQTTITTGTCLGYASVVACSTFLPKYLPSFTWLTDKGRAAADPERLLATAQTMMARRGVTCSDAEAALFLETARRAGYYEVRG